MNKTWSLLFASLILVTISLTSYLKYILYALPHSFTRWEGLGVIGFSCRCCNFDYWVQQPLKMLEL